MSLSHELLGMENVGLAWGFRVSPSSCENPLYYSQYIQLSAMGDQKSGQSMTHVLVDDEIGLLAGYVSLRATSLISVGETVFLLFILPSKLQSLQLMSDMNGKA